MPSQLMGYLLLYCQQLRKLLYRLEDIDPAKIIEADAFESHLILL